MIEAHRYDFTECSYETATKIPRVHLIQSRQQFAQLLTEGIYRIRANEDKAIGIIQDELGYALGREGGSAIEHWRRGFQPAHLADLEQLAQLVMKRGRLDAQWLEAFLQHGGHPDAAVCCQTILTTLQSPILLVSEDGRYLTPSPGLQPPLPQFNSTILDDLVAPGGTVNLRDQFYIEREADMQLKHHLLQPGSISTIRAPRQTGKSSLLVRGIHHARQQGANIIHLDMQRVDPNDLTDADTFLHYLATFISLKLGLDRQAVDEAWRDPIGSQDKLTFFLETAVLPQLTAPLILALDEADRLLETDFHTSFFALLRAWHNSAAYDPLWEQLHLVLVISTEPYLLISNINQSPFNVGLKLYLEDFTPAQVDDLNQRHNNPLSPVDLPAFYDLLSGHPYLCRQALYTMIVSRLSWAELTAAATRDTGPFSDHLRHQQWLLEQEPALLSALKEIIANGRCPDDHTRFRLLRAGLIHTAGNACTCRCELYRRYFSQ